MIKILKLQKALLAIIAGVVALIAYLILSANDIEWSRYILTLSGGLLILGAILFMYPILFARKDKEGCIELDSEVVVEIHEEEAESQP